MANSVPNNKSDAQKRRSSRIVQAVPLMVTGVDALGRPFQERTSTLIVNCHGCRYQSKHYVLKNMWVTLEVPHPEAGHQPRSVRARVMWIQRPRTVRELFQVGVELEVGGNLWGIAFPPPDWFPFPDSGASQSEIPAPAMSAAPPSLEPAPEVAPESVAETAADEEQGWSAPAVPEAAETNLRTMPSSGPGSMPVSAPASGQVSGGVDPSLLAARQMMRLLNEAKQTLQATARESAAQAVTAEARPLIAALHNQLRDAAKQSVDAATEQAVQGLMEQTAHAGEAQLQQLREYWNAKLAESVEQASQNLNARLGEVEQERRLNFVQQLEAETQRAVENLQRVTQEFQGKLGDAQGGVNQLVRQAEEAAAPAIQEIEQRLRTHAEQARAQFNEFERAAREWNEQMTSAASAAQSSWQARLETDLNNAGQRWNERIESSMESAAQQAAAHLTQRSRETADQITTETGLRIAELGKSMIDASAEVEQKLASLRGTLDQQAARTQAVLAQGEAAAREVEEQYQQFEALDQTALQEMERRSASLLEAQTQELSRRAETALSTWTERLQPSMEEAGRQTVSRLGAQLETEFSSQLDRAARMLGQLENSTHSADAALRRHQDDLGKLSEQAIQAAIGRMQGAIGRLEHELEESSRTAAAKWISEIDAKATETTHTTFESLFKTAEWYEKKVNTQMHAALEKGMEQTTEVLRNKAGEISGVFAAELDHYSRSYVEHTHGQIEDTAREAIEGVRKQSAEMSASSAAAIQQQTANQTESALSLFRAKAGVTMGQAASQLESLATQARAKFEADSQRAQAEFRLTLAQDAQQSAGRSRQDLAAQAELAKQDVRAEGERQETQLHATLGALSDQFIENYKQRLENASNSWLLTTVSKLNEQSTQQLDELARSADARLRETCGQVFATVGETLRKRLLNLTAPFTNDEAGEASPEKPPSESR